MINVETENISADDLMRDANNHSHLRNWTPAHDNELKFQEGKLRARKIQAVEEGVIEGDDELRHDLRKVKAKRIQDQRARERKELRDNAAQGMSCSQAREDIKGKSVHVVTIADYLPRLHAVFRNLEMTVVEKDAADVFVLDKPGDAPKSIMLTSCLRGSFHVSPQLLL